ncbi:MFS transporter [Tumebacillus sp. ITR2]|uniref:MFS transporter n=1 Tax=Tumebacillus amylolyticus TaxID=2801339 RepID=A0ABS1J4S9_9BACL|nr:MFS transporter [Tumebacillus amylolyticus]MBL0385291.1 MFS transporter [Tumebacillus amylolyticus]
MESLRAYPRALWMMALSVTISAIGESFLWPLTTSYIETFGKSLTVAGLVLLCQYATMLVGNLAGGWLFDRWSGRKTLLLSITAAMLILLAMGTWRSFPLYVGLLIVLGFFQGTFWPILRALSTVIWPEGGRRAVNMIYVANNLGVAIGAVIGGILASHSFTLAFYGNALSYILFLLLFMSNISESHVEKAKSSKTDSAGSKGAPREIKRETWVALWLLTIGLGLMVVTYSQWQTTMSMYVQSTGISLSSYSVLWTVNGLVIVLLQPLLSWCIQKYAWTLQTQILIAAGLFALAMATVVVWPAYTGFIVGMVILTMGEMLAWPGVPALAAEMAVPGREGMFQGIVTSGQSAGRMIGPLFGAFLFERISAQGMIGFMIVLCVLAAVFFLLYDRFGLRKSFSVSRKIDV